MAINDPSPDNLTSDERRDPILNCFINLFRGYVQYAGDVPILTTIPPTPEIPSIIMGIDSQADGDNEQINAVLEPLPPGHPHYDADDPDKLYCQGMRNRYEGPGSVTLWISGRSTVERDSLRTQCRKAIIEAKNYHYKHCIHYNHSTGVCASTNSLCDAISQSSTYYNIYRCPYANISDMNSPLYRNPINRLVEAGISPPTVTLHSPNYMEDTSIDPEIYGVKFSVSFKHTGKYIIPLPPVCSIEPDDTVL